MLADKSNKKEKKADHRADDPDDDAGGGEPLGHAQPLGLPPGGHREHEPDHTQERDAKTEQRADEAGFRKAACETLVGLTLLRPPWRPERLASGRSRRIRPSPHPPLCD